VLGGKPGKLPSLSRLGHQTVPERQAVNSQVTSRINAQSKLIGEHALSVISSLDAKSSCKCCYGAKQHNPKLFLRISSCALRFLSRRLVWYTRRAIRRVMLRFFGAMARTDVSEIARNKMFIQLIKCDSIVTRRVNLS
jgi:hypothetical protein